MNLSQAKRYELIQTLEYLKRNVKETEIKFKIDEIELELNKKKYGLVWEEHEEKVDEELKKKIPVFKEDKELEIIKDSKLPINFLIEGDNLHSLYLLEKTHKKKVDVIYIDPPYNTGSKDFIYDDKIIDNEDQFKHSKWLSFMSNRLNIAKKLLSDEGIIFISIDDNEYSQLKLLCDEIFGENNFVGNIVWEKRTKCQNTKTAKYMLQSKTEFILVYKNKETKYEFVLDFEAKRKYPDLDEKGEKYRLEKIGEMSASGIRGRETMIFDIEGIYPKKGNQWKYGRETVEKFKKRGDLVIKNKKAYFRIRECDEEEKMKPFWSLLLKDIGTAESAKVELNNILKTKQHGFETVKPVNLIKNLIYHVVGENPNATILDFFAGSGTTGQAVLELNQEDNGNRKFILCTNNENNICRNITYERLYKIINGYSNSKGKKIVGTPSNLKYYKTKYIDKYILPNDEIELSDELMENIKELVMLENNIYIDNKKIKIAFSEEQLEEMLKDTGTIEKIYISSDILITNKQEEIINDAKIEIIDIPEYYYREEIED